MCAAPRCCNGETAFIGFYAVEPMYQKLGIGRELWSKTVGNLDENLNKGLYGVPEMVEKYKQSGFVKEDSISMLVYETEPDILKADLKLDSLCTLSQLDSEGQLKLEILNGQKIGDDDHNDQKNLFENLVSFDARVNGFSREQLLKEYLIGNDIPLTVIVSGPNNSIHGYGIIRKDNNLGGIIGPIYANNQQVCEIILHELIDKFALIGGKIFTVMPLTSNQQAVEILKRIGFVEKHECSRLFTKYIPVADMARIFFIHSPNFTLF